MKLQTVTYLLCTALAASVSAMHTNAQAKGPLDTKKQPILRPHRTKFSQCTNPLAPKLFIISLFLGEETTWYHRPDINLLAQNIAVPGFSPLFPDAHCTSSGEICQMTTGPGEINAAASLMALWMSNCFDLSKTYFLIAGIGGVNPHVATTGSVVLARYAVQFDLQYEVSYNQIPEELNWKTGYVPLGTKQPARWPCGEMPSRIYGTEVFELNDNLKKRAVAAAKRATLSDTAEAQIYRKEYAFSPARNPPSVVECDSGTSNIFWSGSVLGEAFETYAKLLTNGRGRYCVSQQEDNAILEALLRGDVAGKVDFGRVILMRTASDFDRAPPGMEETEHLLYEKQGGLVPSLENVYLAGREIVKDVLKGWEEVYEGGVETGNYVGQLAGSLADGVDRLDANRNEH